MTHQRTSCKFRVIYLIHPFASDGRRATNKTQVCHSLLNTLIYLTCSREFSCHLLKCTQLRKISETSLLYLHTSTLTSIYNKKYFNFYSMLLVD